VELCLHDLHRNCFTGLHFWVFAQGSWLVPVFWRNILPPSSGWLNLADVDADVAVSEPLCWVCRQVEAFWTNQSSGRGQGG
jgi:hypothetical protein